MNGPKTTLTDPTGRRHTTWQRDARQPRARACRAAACDPLSRGAAAALNRSSHDTAAHQRSTDAIGCSPLLLALALPLALLPLAPRLDSNASGANPPRDFTFDYRSAPRSTAAAMLIGMLFATVLIACSHSRLLACSVCECSYWSFNPADAHFATNPKVYADLGVSVLNNAWAGFNCSCLAYGQTGAGHTRKTEATRVDSSAASMHASGRR